MPKSSFTLHLPQTSDPTARSVVYNGRRQGAHTFDGVWSRRSESIYPLYNLAVVIAYLQLGLADVEFSRTSRSGPSNLVLVVGIPRSRLVENLLGNGLLPFPVNWRVWHNVAVPVLNNTRWKLSNGFSAISNGLNQPSVILGNFQNYVLELQTALIEEAQSGGLIPPPNQGENTENYNGIYTTNNIPEKKCCCPEGLPDCCEE